MSQATKGSVTGQCHRLLGRAMGTTDAGSCRRLHRPFLLGWSLARMFRLPHEQGEVVGCPSGGNRCHDKRAARVVVSAASWRRRNPSGQVPGGLGGY